MDQVAKIARWLKSIIAPSNQDLKIVAFSILIASIIWVLSALNESYTTQISCPITFQYEPEGTIVVKSPPDLIQANVTGIGWNILKQTITFNRDPLEITLENPVETKYIAGYTIQPLLSQHLTSLDLNFVVTDSINFDIQPLRSKQVLLDVDSAAIDLENQYRIITPINISPDSSEVSGPANMIDTLPDTVFIPMPMQDLDESVNRLFPVNPYDRDLFSFQPAEAQVEIEVSRFIDLSRDFPIELVNFPIDSSAYLNRERIALSFKIQEDFADEFPETDFMIIADFNNINPEDSTLNLELIEFPFYVQDIDLDTTSVKVIYETEDDS